MLNVSATPEGEALAEAMLNDGPGARAVRVEPGGVGSLLDIDIQFRALIAPGREGGVGPGFELGHLRADGKRRQGEDGEQPRHT